AKKVLELPVTSDRTPRGTPAFSARTASAMAEYGVSGEGWATTVQPMASAAPILRVSIADGKFQGVMTPTTPTGSRQLINRLSFRCVGMVAPYARTASSANQSRNPAA